MGLVGSVAPASCDGGNVWNYCSATTNGSQVDVSGTTNTPGTRSPGGSGGGSGPSRGGGADASENGSGGAGDDSAATDPACTSALCRPSYAVVSLPDVTAADLVSFVPSAPAVTGEPRGIGVVGMPTNLVATASAQTLSGPLLGYDVTVRFTPVAYRFDHGDGTGRTSATGGAPWGRLGMPEFTPTATSHAYRDPGRYRVTARVVYDAAVDFGNGSWRPVTGAVTSEGAGYDVRIVEVRTALVERTCAEDPSGPGC